MMIHEKILNKIFQFYATRSISNNQKKKKKADKLSFIEVKNIFKSHYQESGETIQRTGKNNCITGKGLVSRIYKENLQLKNNRPPALFKNEQTLE